ncbi:Ede1 protein [Saccharomycopsis crataegensis]|uniref:Ede1 protein n=1 Tax=Saccharomycopsis crataegensis TaxID=43959 RepID=A0AAV5QWL4_9ASCO|nr:Ede1 protein [Saccharomycopsis crataegensis]
MAEANAGRLPSSFQLPTPEEKVLYSKIFKSLDQEKLGLVTGEVAGLTFEKSGLDSQTLYQIWEISDAQGNGFLKQLDFIRALRLIGHVQSGKALDANLANIPAPAPKFQGLNYGMSPVTTGLPSQGTGSSLQKHYTSSSLQSTAQLPPVTPADISKFIQLFNRHVPSSYPSISGMEAREIFLKAKLQENILGLIWNACDRGAKGNLSKDEFCLAMFLIQGMLRGSIKQVPTSVSETTWSQINQILVSINYGNNIQQQNSIQQQSTGNLLGLDSEISHGAAIKPVIQTIPEARSVQISESPKVTHSSAIPQIEQGSIQPLSSGAWTISPQQKQQFDQLFDSLDKSHKGTLGPNEVASFLMSSKLSQDDLANVWNLADLKNSGIFTKVEFAISMFLVQKRLRGENLPVAIPQELLSSVNGQDIAATQKSTGFAAVASAAPPKPPQVRQSSMNDLADIFGSSPQAPPANLQRSASVQVSNTGGSQSSFSSGPGASRRFKPTSSFGQQIVHQQEVNEVQKTSLLQLDEAKEDEDDSGDDSDINYFYKSYNDKRTAPPIPTSTKPNYDILKDLSVPGGSQPVVAPSVAPPPPAARGTINDNNRALQSEYDTISNEIVSEHVETSNTSAQIKSMEAQSTELKSMISKAKTQLAAAQEAKSNFESRLQQAKALLEEETQQYDGIKKSVIESQQENEELRQKSSILEAEYNNHQAEYQNYQAQLTEKQNENAVFKEKLGTMTAENNDLLKRLENIKKALKDQVAFNNIQERQIEVLKTKNVTVVHEIKGIEAELENSKSIGAQKEAEVKALESSKNSVPVSTIKSIDTSADTTNSTQKLAGVAAVAGVAGLASGAILHNHASGDDHHDSGRSTPVKKNNPFLTGFTAPPGAESMPSLENLTFKSVASDDAPVEKTESLPEPSLDEAAFPSESDDKNQGSPLTPATGSEIIKADGMDDVGDLENFTEFPTQADFESQFDDNKSNTEKETNTVVTKETSDTSPPTSDFQFGGNNPTGLQFPFGGNTIRRPESLTSSVQNNAAMSVRDESVTEYPSSDGSDHDEAIVPETSAFAPPPIPARRGSIGSDSSESSDDDFGPQDIEQRTFRDNETVTGVDKEIKNDDVSPIVIPAASIPAPSTNNTESWFENLDGSNVEKAQSMPADYQSVRANSISTSSDIFMDANEDIVTSPVTQQGSSKMSYIINTGKSKLDIHGFDGMSPSIDEKENPMNNNNNNNIITSTNNSHLASFNAGPFDNNKSVKPSLGLDSDFDSAFDDLSPVTAESAGAKNTIDDFDAAFDDLEPVKENNKTVGDFDDLQPAIEKHDFDSAFDDLTPAMKGVDEFDNADFDNLAPLQDKAVEADNDNLGGNDLEFDDDFTEFDTALSIKAQKPHGNDNDEFDSAFNF